VTDETLGGNAQAELRSFVERIENLNEEIGALQEDRSEVFKEAKSTGFDTKVLRGIIRERKLDAADRQHLRSLTETYLHALGMD